MINIEVPFFKGVLNHLSETVLTLGEPELINLYANWNCSSSIKEVLTFDSCAKAKISTTQMVPPDANTCGIDLPSWYGDYNKAKMKILFVGIDPMRNEKEFDKRGIDVNNDVVIGTPYALHLDKFRKEKRSSYSEFISKLSEKNFVYLTDIYKTFFYTTKDGEVQRSYDYYGHKEYSNDILNKEIELIQPNLIITFGGESFKRIMGTNHSPVLSQNINNLKTKYKYNNHTIDLLPLMHLSGINRTQNLNNFLLANGYEDKKRDRLECARCFVELINKL